MKKLRIGAVNWDASMSADSYFGYYQVNSLSQAKYREWTPYYATVIDSERITYRARTAREYEREMQYAIDAGIDYFAFVWYPTEGSVLHTQTSFTDCSHRVHELNFARHLYEETAIKDKLNMCAIVGSHPFSDADINELLEAFCKPYYEKIDGRPLMYLYGGYREEIIEKIHTGAKKRGIPTPFTVPMVEGGERVDMPLADALSAYAICSRGVDTYEELIDYGNKNNAKRCELGLPVIPTLTLGWNPTPRLERPTPWTTKADGGSVYPRVSYAPPATPCQLLDGAAAFAESVLKWDASSRVPHVLAFAWNEFEEGGFICPTYTADGGVNATRVEIFAQISALLREKLGDIS
jgi:hypothetical protein